MQGWRGEGVKKGWRGEGGEEKNVEKHEKCKKKKMFFEKKKSCAQKLANQKARNLEFAFFFLLPMKEAKFTLSDWSVLITSKCSNLIGSIMHKLSRKRKQLGNRENE